MTSTRMLFFPAPPAVPEQSSQTKLTAKQFAEIFDLSPDLLCLTTLDGRFRCVNTAWEAALGLSKAEILATPRAALIHPDDRESVMASDRSTAIGMKDVSFEARFRCKDGSYKWLLWSQVFLPEQQAILGSARDITRRKKEEDESRRSCKELEERFREASTALTRTNAVLLAEISHRRQVVESLCEVKEKYRSVFENAVEGIFQSTPEGTYLSANPALARIKGYDSPEELIVDMRNIGEQSYVDPNRRLQFKELMDKDGMVKGFEYEIYRKDGQKVWLSMNTRAVRDAGGTLLYYEGTVEDITERKRLEDQLRLAQKMEAVGRLAGGIAHDFNNLLGVVNGHTELLLSRIGEGSSSRWNAEEIHKASKRATAFVRQLLAFSQRQILQPTVLNPNSVVQDMESMLGRVIGEDVVLTTVLDSAVGRVKADRGQIDQVILNLALNARDAMPQGGELTIETANLDVKDLIRSAQGGYIPAGPYVAITVKDTGIGMDAATQARIFEPFFTTKDQGKGTGLGLATVYGVVQQSGGFISLQSAPEKGTTFQILFPRVDELETATPAPEALDRSWSGSETVLLVEDDSALRALVMSLLSSLGYKVLEASNGLQAVRVVRQQGNEIDLLLTDIVMPGLRGPNLANEVTSLFPDIKVLYMSGYPESACSGTISLGGKPLLEKPFKQADLARKLREVLEGASVGQPLAPQSQTQQQPEITR